ncbi:hypothetical protein, partial [Escherichia coli]|uniref:hypothetical protein n=1 Tax=Escherichia coli TaxID=562 RepID=UPI002916E5C2
MLETNRHKPISINTAITCEVVGIQTEFANKSLRIFSLYSPLNTNNMSEIPLLFDSNTPTIVAGDLNAKNKHWGCLSNNTKGNSLWSL